VGLVARRLRALVRTGLARVEGQTNGPTGAFTAAHYYAVDSDLAVDNHRGQGV
jgi:hypothetical protein